MSLQCGHYVDATSLTQYSRSLISEQKFKLSCPALVNKPSEKLKKCGKIWEYAEVRKKALLNEAECQYYESKLSEFAAANMIDMKECPWCRSFVEREDPNNLRVTCPVCKKNGKNDFCWQCKNEWSGPSTSDTKCGNEKCEHPDLPSIRDCKMVQLPQAGNISVPIRRACPTCGRICEHNLSGCKNIICPKCQKEFCFACLKLTTDCLKLKPQSWYQECANPVAPKQTKIPIWSQQN